MIDDLASHLCYECDLGEQGGVMVIGLEKEIF